MSLVPPDKRTSQPLTAQRIEALRGDGTKVRKAREVRNSGDIEALRGDGTDRWIKVAGTPCLYVRVRPSGDRYFAVRVKRDGRITVHTLSAWPDLSLKQARFETAKYIGARAGKAVHLDVTEALAQFFEDHVEARWKDTRNAQVYRRAIEKALGRRLLGELTRADVASMVRRYRLDREGNPRLVAANRLLAFVKLFCGWCQEAGLLDENPAAALTTRIAGGDETARERVLTEAEIQTLWHWNGPHVHLLRALLLTGCRIGELQKAQTQHVKSDRLVIPEQHSKNGRAHWVHITPTLRAQFNGREPLLFRWASPTAVQASLRRWQRANPEAWTPHDLRRTFSTLAAQLGTPPHVIKALINHKEDGSLPIYQRHDWAAERIAATKAIEAHVLNLVGGDDA